MICEHPQCTGRHKNDNLAADQCPRARERKYDLINTARRRRYESDPDYYERERQRAGAPQTLLKRRRSKALGRGRGGESIDLSVMDPSIVQSLLRGGN